MVSLSACGAARLHPDPPESSWLAQRSALIGQLPFGLWSCSVCISVGPFGSTLSIHQSLSLTHARSSFLFSYFHQAECQCFPFFTDSTPPVPSSSSSSSLNPLSFLLQSQLKAVYITFLHQLNPFFFHPAPPLPPFNPSIYMLVEDRCEKGRKGKKEGRKGRKNLW